MRKILLLLFFSTTSMASFTPVDWDKYKPVKIMRNESLTEKSSRKEEWKPIRFRVFYAKSVFDELPIDQTKLIQKIMKRALEFFDVKVRPSSDFGLYKTKDGSKFKKMCAGNPVSDEFNVFTCSEEDRKIGCTDNDFKPLKVKLGIFMNRFNSDFLGRDGSTIAEAIFCSRDPEIEDRPVAGKVTIMKDKLEKKMKKILRGGEDELYTTILHEMAHALFFSSCPFWRAYPKAKELYKDNLKRSEVYPETKGSGVDETFHGIAFPKSLKEARKYFDCPDMKYIELENSKYPGSELGHYEADFLPYETMRGDDIGFPLFFSRITLALMEDSGWYKVNYSKAEPMPAPLSKDACKAVKSCKLGDYNGKPSFIKKCETDRKAYYSRPHQSSMAECPIPKRFVCSHSSGSEDWKCLEHERMKFLPRKPNATSNSRYAQARKLYGGLCYEFICNDGSFQFVSGQNYYDCKKEGDKVTFKQKYGKNNHFRQFYEETTEEKLDNKTELNKYSIDRTVICPKYCETKMKRIVKTSPVSLLFSLSYSRDVGRSHSTDEMRTIFLLLFFVATSTASDVIFKWENYKPVKMTRKLPDKSSEERKWEPIRYRVFYDDSVFDDIPVSQTKLLQKVIKRALKFFDVKVQREEEFSIYKSLNVNTSKYENMCEDTVLSNKYDFYECAEGTEEKGCDDEDMGRTSGKKDLTNNDKRAIVVGHQNGLTMMTLAGMFGVTEACISQFLKRQKAQDGSTKSQRTGRPRVTDLNDDRNILKTPRTNPRLTALAIRREVFLNSPSPPSVSTVKRRLNAAGIMGRRAEKKTVISEKNRAARVKWVSTGPVKTGTRFCGPTKRSSTMFHKEELALVGPQNLVPVSTGPVQMLLRPLHPGGSILFRNQRRRFTVETDGGDGEFKKTSRLMARANIDYVWFVLIEDRPSFAATAGPCNYFPGTNMKPNVGLLNVGRATLSDAESRITREGEENLYNILRHEMSHALFFNEIFFMKAFPDSANLFKKTTRSIVYSETLGSGMNETFYGIAFPKALEEARKYLECPDLQYIELENSGDEATAGSHYDVDFLPYETMRSDIAPFRIAYSRISLALMEDSGWYKVDYSKAEPMQPPLSKDACRAAKSCKFSDYKGQLNFTTKCDTDRKGYLGMPHKSKFADCPVPQHIICSYTYGSEDWKCLEHETVYNGLCYEIICNEGSFQFVSGQDYFDCKKEGDKVTFKQNYGINNHFRHLYEQTTETVLNNITFLSNYTAERTVICPKYCEVCAEKDPKTCKEEEAEEEEEEDEVCDDD
ncbi:unnamed protein product [Caenorhabditis auriculariae]|uniref:Leishmanolysin-like peptidase n=1 Tax=Caenorhabditis auriculariae TaxID=2777116 RepID=A0A8S1HY01_9PELO|nr:unnamed protein product [Caenorhabditis auriculariae]